MTESCFLTGALRVLGRDLVRELGVVESASSPAGMSLPQCHVLIELERHGTLTANELAGRLLVDKAAISRTVAQMLESGLLALRGDPADRRRKPLALTAHGAKKAVDIHKSANLRIDEAMAVLTSDEQQAVAAGLELYVQALNRARRQKSYTIRTVSRTDGPEVTRLIRTVLAEFGGQAGTSPAELAELADVAKAYAGPKAAFFVVEHKGRLVGCGGLRAAGGKGDPATCELRRMYLLQEARGLGLGRMLLQRCLSEAERLGYRRCELTATSQMVHAQKLYEKCGFLRREQTLAGGRNGDELFYLKDLAAEPRQRPVKVRRTLEARV